MGQVMIALTALPWRVGGVNREPLAMRCANGMSSSWVEETTEINSLRPVARMATRTTTRPLLASLMLRGKTTDGLRSKRGCWSSSPSEYSDFVFGKDKLTGACCDDSTAGLATLGRATSTSSGKGEGG